MSARTPQSPAPIGSKAKREFLHAIAKSAGVVVFESEDSLKGNESKVLIHCANASEAIAFIKKPRGRKYDFTILTDKPAGLEELIALFKAGSLVSINVDALDSYRIRPLAKAITSDLPNQNGFFHTNGNECDRASPTIQLRELFPDKLPLLPEHPEWMEQSDSSFWTEETKETRLSAADWQRLFLGFSEDAIKHVHYLVLLGNSPQFATSLEEKLSIKSIFFSRSRAAIVMINKGGRRNQARECIQPLLEHSILLEWLTWPDRSESMEMVRRDFCQLALEVECIEELIERLVPLEEQLAHEQNAAIRKDLANVIAAAGLETSVPESLNLSSESPMNPEVMSFRQIKLALSNRIRTSSFDGLTLELAEQVKSRLPPKKSLPLLSRHAATAALAGDLETSSQLLELTDFEAFESYDKDISTFITTIHNARAFDKADALYERFAKLPQATSGLNLRWAMTKVCLNETEAAKALLQDELKDHGPSDGVIFWRARLKRLADGVCEAQAELEQYLPSAASPIVKFYYLCEIALCHADKGELLEAREKLKQAIDTDKNNPLWVGIACFEDACLALLLEGQEEAKRRVANWLPIAVAANQSPKQNPGISLAQLLNQNSRGTAASIAVHLQQHWPLPQFPYHKWGQFLAQKWKGESTAPKLDFGRKLTPFESQIVSSIDRIRFDSRPERSKS